MTLGLSVAGQELEVSRTLYRTKQTAAQLTITYPDGAQDTVRNQRSVTSRIIAELGNLDKDALLNSCFVEQKKLDKLEGLNAEERRRSLENLLNLNKLSQVQERMKITRQDEYETKTARGRLALATAQAQVPKLHAELESVERRLLALALNATSTKLEAQRRNIRQLEADAERLSAERATLEASIEKIDTLKATRDRLAAVRDCCREMDEAAAQEESYANTLASLDARERDELPHLNERLAKLDALNHVFDTLNNEIVARSTEERHLAGARQELQAITEHTMAAQELLQKVTRQQAGITQQIKVVDSTEQAAKESLGALTTRRIALQKLASDCRQLDERQQAIAAATANRDQASEYAQLQHGLAAIQNAYETQQAKAGEAEQAYRAAQQTYIQTREAEALNSWIHAEQDRQVLAGVAERRAAAERGVAEAEAALHTYEEAARKTSRQRMMIGGVGALILVIGLPLLIFMPLLGIPFLLAGIAGVAFAWRISSRLAQLRRDMQTTTETLSQKRADREKVNLEYAAAQARHESDARRAAAIQTLQAFAAAVPSDRSGAETRLAQLCRSLGCDSAHLPSSQHMASAINEKQQAVNSANAALTQIGLRRQAIDDQRNRHPGRGLQPADYYAGLLPDLKQTDATLTAEIERQAQQYDTGVDQVQDVIGELTGQITEQQRILDSIPHQRMTIRVQQTQLETDRQSLSREQAWLEKHDRSAIEQQIAATEITLQARLATLTRLQQEAKQQAAVIGVAAAQPIVLSERGRVEAARTQLEQVLAQRRDYIRQLGEARQKRHAALEQASAAWQHALPLPAGLATPPTSPPTKGELIQLDQTIADQLRLLREPVVRHRLSQVDQQSGAVRSAIRQEEATINGLELDMQRILATLDITLASMSRDAIAEAFPLIDQLQPGDEQLLHNEQNRLEGELAVVRHTCTNLATELATGEELLDAPTCTQELEAQERRIAIKDRAGKVVTAVRKRLVEKVLPSTTHNMSILLPIMTLQRYRECELTPDYKLKVWDEQAERFVAKNIFSGGTRDQFSLALRLAFAIATLPQQLGTTPSFLFLDEPLSSFDIPRTEALIQLLTGGFMRGYFKQIFIISHNQMFDRRAFTHRIVLENGRVAEHTLGEVPAASEV